MVQNLNYHYYILKLKSNNIYVGWRDTYTGIVWVIVNNIFT